jgi:1-acyl-sn-glycerol-3-phosphate acyltransferase
MEGPTVFYWLMKGIILGPLTRLLYRPWVKGLENVPESGGAIVAGNHLAVFDSFIAALVLPRKVTFLGKAEWVEGKGIRGRLKAFFMNGVGLVPVDRTDSKASAAALRTGLRILEEGKLFGIYPEGTRSPDGRLYRGKTGVARLALHSGAPVIPIVMIGTNIAQPIGRVIPRPMRVGVVIGEPLDFSRYQGLVDDRFVLRAVTDEIMYTLMGLSGQEYVDIYAATAKARLAAGKPVEREGGAPGPGGRQAPPTDE